MRSANFFVLLFGAAASQSVITVMNAIETSANLTLMGHDSTAATYERHCPSPPSNSRSGSSEARQTLMLDSPTTRARPSSSSPGVIELTPISAPPATTAAARLRREEPYNELCKNYTIVQASDHWSFHAVDPLTPADWIMDASCNWSGATTTADMTCTIIATGQAWGTDARSEVSTVKASDVASASLMDEHATVVKTVTAGDRSLSASGPSSSATAATQSPGHAASVPLPTGAMAFAGAAAGLYAAALAL